MISILYGPGGSGKSLFQMFLIVDQLRFTRRNIGTNLSIKIPEFTEWMEARYPNEDTNVSRRIRILTDTEMRDFWQHRGNLRWTAGLVQHENGYHDPELVVDKGVFGCCYVLDEAGAAGFGAKGWAAREGTSTRGDACTWYLDQQRKFGDDVFASTNGTNPNGIAKPFRDKAHNFVRLHNGYARKLGPFRATRVFHADYFYSEPGPNVERFARKSFNFGTGLENCYRTEQGVGVTGFNADKGSKVKGIPAWSVFPIAIGIGAVCIGVPYLMGKGLGHAVQKERPPAVAPVVPGTQRTIGERFTDSVARAVHASPDGERASASLAGLQIASWGSWSDGQRGERNEWVVMSDGFRYEFPEARQVNDEVWEVLGKFYRLKHRLPGGDKPDGKAVVARPGAMAVKHE